MTASYPQRSLLPVIALLLLFAFFLWVPLLFASNRGFLWSMNGALLAGLGLLLLWGDRSEQSREGIAWLGPLAFALLLGWVAASVLVSAVFQPLAAIFDEGAWADIAASGLPMTSFAPSDSALGLVCLGGYGVLWWVSLRLSRRGLSDMILWLVLIAVTLHAVYGMVESRVDFDFPLTEIVGDDFDGPANAGFVNRNHFATFLGLGAVIALVLMLDAVRRFTVFGERSSALPRFVLAAAALGLVMTAQVMSQSRMGLGSTVLALTWVVFVFALANGRWFVGLVFLILLGALMFGLSFFGIDVLERLQRSEVDLDTRLNIYRQALELWQLRPWTGFGMGSFETVFAVGKDSDLSGRLWTRAHNSYITALVELGVIGLALLMFVFAWLGLVQLRAGLAQRSVTGFVGLGCLVLVAAHATLDFSLEIYAVVAVLIPLLALSSGATDSAPPARQVSQHRHSKARGRSTPAGPASTPTVVTTRRFKPSNPELKSEDQGHEGD